MHYRTNYIMITLKINSRQLFTEPDNLMYEIKTEDVYKDFKETIKKALTLVIIQLSQIIMIIQTNKWLIKRKMKQLVL